MHYKQPGFDLEQEFDIKRWLMKCVHCVLCQLLDPPAYLKFTEIRRPHREFAKFHCKLMRMRKVQICANLQGGLRPEAISSNTHHLNTLQNARQLAF